MAGEIKHWSKFVNISHPLVIYYPACGGGEECITACPFKDKIWDLEPMNVSLFGIKEDIRYRPVMKNPEACKECYLCVEACPTGALVLPKDYPIKHPILNTLKVMALVPFRKRYGLKYTLNYRHLVAFMKNNFENYRQKHNLNDKPIMAHHIPWADKKQNKKTKRK